MFIKSFKFLGVEPNDWIFSKISFRKVNLLVGASGSGKSRILNTISNLALFLSKGTNFIHGHWQMEYTNEGVEYRYELIAISPPKGNIITKEKLEKKIDENEYQTLIERDETVFKFNGNPLPKLPKDAPGIFLLQGEQEIENACKAFAKILRRNFNGDDLINAVSVNAIPNELTKNETRQKFWTENKLFLPINIRMFYLQKHYINTFNRIISEFKEIFPNVLDLKIGDASHLVVGGVGGDRFPIININEKAVKYQIPIHEMSSGMQKVLFMIIDLHTIDTNSIYIIDEYENSLGINAIDFLPSHLIMDDTNTQFIITSHHPYLINKMPIKNWHLVSRNGNIVNVADGPELDQRYKSSNQDAFIQLINDPQYQGD